MNSTSNFSLISILSGLNKTLNVAKNVMPLIEQTKPLISNVRTAYSLIKDVNSHNTKTTSKTPIKKEAEKTIIKTNSNPQFFI
ncbi:MAG: hypothetical protein PHG03_04940 [Bacilli bacterium]|nr:hypothetical protein [Bacilli bacterium]MDD4795881.1 hypothetical protein [Bacilli bacterium]